MEKSIPWGSHRVVAGQVIGFEGRHVKVAVKIEKEGCLIREIFFEETAINPESGVSGDEPGWEGALFVQTGSIDEIHFLPAPPDRPVVYRTDEFAVSPRREISFFLAIPLSVMIYTGNPETETPIREIELTRLRHTWLGETDDGEPAYAITGNIHSSTAFPALAGNEAICGINLINNSSANFDSDRIVIRTEKLGLFRWKGKIISNSVSIEYKGGYLSATYFQPDFPNGDPPVLIHTPKAGSLRKTLKTLFRYRES